MCVLAGVAVCDCLCVGVSLSFYACAAVCVFCAGVFLCLFRSAVYKLCALVWGRGCRKLLLAVYFCPNFSANIKFVKMNLHETGEQILMLWLIHVLITSQTLYPSAEVKIGIKNRTAH